MVGHVLVTGSNGLVGTDLVSRLDSAHLVACDLASASNNPSVTYLKIDVRDFKKLEEVVRKYKISAVYHLAGLLSFGGEKNPPLAWDININGLKNILDLAAKYHLQVFWPSSIAVFGSTTPKIKTPQHTILEPATMYGVTKVAGELLCQYYHSKYGVDVRSLRYPGLIAWKAPPGDGTTEYSVHIFYSALKSHHYTCFLKSDTALPMMYIDDAISGTLNLMSAPAENITVRTGYNFSALSFTPKELAAEITKQLPGFTCDYQPDNRQIIADSWPRSIDDSAAQNDWDWQPEYDLPRLVTEMLTHLQHVAK